MTMIRLLSLVAAFVANLPFPSLPFLSSKNCRPVIPPHHHELLTSFHTIVRVEASTHCHFKARVHLLPGSVLRCRAQDTALLATAAENLKGSNAKTTASVTSPSIVANLEHTTRLLPLAFEIPFPQLTSYKPLLNAPTNQFQFLSLQHTADKSASNQPLLKLLLALKNGPLSRERQRFGHPFFIPLSTTPSSSSQSTPPSQSPPPVSSHTMGASLLPKKPSSP